MHVRDILEQAYLYSRPTLIRGMGPPWREQTQHLGPLGQFSAGSHPLFGVFIPGFQFQQASTKRHPNKDPASGGQWTSAVWHSIGRAPRLAAKGWPGAVCSS